MLPINKGEERTIRAEMPPPYLDQLTFDDDTLTALNGTIVWKSLADPDKVFDAGQFGAHALLHNLREQDFGYERDTTRRKDAIGWLLWRAGPPLSCWREGCRWRCHGN